MTGMFLLLLVGCPDYNLNFDDKGGGGFDSADDTADTDTDTTPPPAEECNGFDDDGDGTVDEGFEDSDGDGVADCVDAACADLDLAPAGTLPIVEACEGGVTTLSPPVTDPFRARVKWRNVYDLATGPSGLTSSPDVAYLFDDDGDGRIGPGDGPELVVYEMGLGEVLIFDGATGSLVATIEGGMQTYQTPTVADLNGDGTPEIVFIDRDGHPTAFEPDGTVLWRADGPARTSFPTFSAADLEGDGEVELAADLMVLEGATGRTRFELPASSDFAWRSPVVADIDLDGTQEILLADQVFDADGTLRWKTGRVQRYGTWAVPVQADTDPEAEVVFLGNGLGVYDTDGTELAFVPIPDDNSAGAPTAADFDGDGEMEIGFPTYSSGGYSVFDLDGTEIWNVPAPLRSFGSGSTTFDFDGDGRFEIVFSVDEGFYVYDGSTGDVLFTMDGHEHPTALEYASVADVDEDGAADLVVVSVLGNTGEAWLTVLEHDGEGWAPGGTYWGNYEFVPGAVMADGSVPAHPNPSWICPAVYRGWPAVMPQCGAPDLVVNITDLCEDDCVAGPASIAVQVGNQGAMPATRVVVDIYAILDAGETLAASVSVGAVAAGELLAAFPVDLPPIAYGAHSLRALVRVDGVTEALAECDSTNNENWRSDICL